MQSSVFTTILDDTIRLEDPVGASQGQSYVHNSHFLEENTPPSPWWNAIIYGKAEQILHNLEMLDVDFEQKSLRSPISCQNKTWDLETHHGPGT